MRYTVAYTQILGGILKNKYELDTTIKTYN